MQEHFLDCLKLQTMAVPVAPEVEEPSWGLMLAPLVHALVEALVQALVQVLVEALVEVL